MKHAFSFHTTYLSNCGLINIRMSWINLNTRLTKNIGRKELIRVFNNLGFLGSELLLSTTITSVSTLPPLYLAWVWIPFAMGSISDLENKIIYNIQFYNLTLITDFFYAQWIRTNTSLSWNSGNSHNLIN